MLELLLDKITALLLLVLNLPVRLGKTSTERGIGVLGTIGPEYRSYYSWYIAKPFSFHLASISILLFLVLCFEGKQPTIFRAFFVIQVCLLGFAYSSFCGFTNTSRRSDLQNKSLIQYYCYEAIQRILPYYVLPFLVVVASLILRDQHYSLTWLDFHSYLGHAFSIIAGVATASQFIYTINIFKMYVDMATRVDHADDVIVEAYQTEKIEMMGQEFRSILRTWYMFSGRNLFLLSCEFISLLINVSFCMFLVNTFSQSLFTGQFLPLDVVSLFLGPAVEAVSRFTIDISHNLPVRWSEGTEWIQSLIVFIFVAYPIALLIAIISARRTVRRLTSRYWKTEG